MLAPDPGSPPRKKAVSSLKSRLLTDGRRVGLKPEKGWAMRNYRYLSGSLLPALISRRERNTHSGPPVFGPLASHEIEVVWIGHASFLVRTPGFNALIDPVWANGWGR